MELSLAGRQVTLKTDLSYQGLAGGALRAPLCLLPGEELRNKSGRNLLGRPCSDESSGMPYYRESKGFALLKPLAMLYRKGVIKGVMRY